VKLRIHGDSLRLRLNRSDVEQFRKTGICAESLRFGSGSQLTYTLEVSYHSKAMQAQYQQDCIRVFAAHRHGPGMGGFRSGFAFPRPPRRWRSLPIDRKGFSVSSWRRGELDRRCECLSESRSANLIASVFRRTMGLVTHELKAKLLSPQKQADLVHRLFGIPTARTGSVRQLSWRKASDRAEVVEA